MRYKVRKKFLSNPVKTDKLALMMLGFRAESQGQVLKIAMLLLAHLSRRLTGELIVYPCAGVRPSSVVVRPSSVVHNFKDLLL